MADRAMTQAAKAREDQPAAKTLPPMGPQGQRVAAIHGLVSGRPLDEVSLHDFPSMEYSDNLFIAGGLGAYVRRLAHDLPIRLGTAVHAIDWSGQGVRIESSAGTLRAKAVIVTTPMAVLQQDAIRFAPALPQRRRGKPSMASRRGSTSMWCCIGRIRPFAVRTGWRA